MGGRRRRRGQSPLLPEVIGRLGAGCTRANLKSDYANSGSLPIFISVYRCWSERLGMTRVVNTVPLKSASAVTGVNVITTLFVSSGYSESGIGRERRGQVKEEDQSVARAQRHPLELLLRLSQLHSVEQFTFTRLSVTTRSVSASKGV